MHRKYLTIVESELEDFESECRAVGIDPKEFDLNEHDYIESYINNIIFNPNAKLTISRGKISKTYLTGNATHWVADFSKDLRIGLFNSKE